MCFGVSCSLAPLNQSLCHFQDLELLQLLQDTSRYASALTVKKGANNADTTPLTKKNWPGISSISDGNSHSFASRGPTNEQQPNEILGFGIEQDVNVYILCMHV